MKEKLLFVTKTDGNFDEGFSYVLELAKSLNAGIEMMIVYGKNVMDTYEDVMAAVAFAEAGDHETVRELMKKEQREIKDIEEKKIKEFAAKCREHSVDFSFRTESGDIITAVRNLLRNIPSIDMVLLSPGLSGNKKLLDIKKMLKQVTRPVVAISRQDSRKVAALGGPDTSTT